MPAFKFDVEMRGIIAVARTRGEARVKRKKKNPPSSQSIEKNAAPDAITDGEGNEK
jgi:hypothetical protein